jgi:hypothetical protein
MKEQTTVGNRSNKITIDIVHTNECGVEMSCVCYINRVNVCDTASGNCTDGRPPGHSEHSLA